MLDDPNFGVVAQYRAASRRFVPGQAPWLARGVRGRVFQHCRCYTAFEPRENAAPNVNAVSSPKFPFPGLMTKSQHGFFGGGAFSYPKSHPHYCHKPWSEVPEQNQNASGERRDKAGGVAVKSTKVILVP